MRGEPSGRGAPEAESGVRRRVRERPGITFLGVACLLFVVHHGVRAMVWDGAWWYPLGQGSRWVGSWIQYDGLRYLEIVRDGYSYDPTVQSTVAWLPVYPLLVAAGVRVGGSPEVWAVAWTFVGGLATAVLLRRWLGSVGVEGAALAQAWWLVVLSPFGWYLATAAYPDSIYLALALGAFVAVAAGRIGWATVLVAVASATRPLAPALVLGVLLLAWERAGLVGPGWRVAWRRLRPRDLLPLAGLGGLVAYACFLAVRFGAPLAFLQTQSNWHDGAAPAFHLHPLRRLVAAWDRAGAAELAVGAVGLVVVVVVAAALARRRGRWVVAGWTVVALATVVGVARWRDVVAHPELWVPAGVQAALLVAVAATVPAVRRRLGIGYAAYTAVLVAIPAVTTANFIGAGRYLLGAFPVAVVWGEWLERQPVWRTVVPVVTTVGLVAGSLAYARSYYLS